MNKHKGCQTVIIAQSRFCSVTECTECGMYHLHIGPFSVRLKREVFEDICETLIKIYSEQWRQKMSGGSVHSH